MSKEHLKKEYRLLSEIEDMKSVKQVRAALDRRMEEILEELETAVTRVEVIGDNGREYVNWDRDNNITLSFQDEGRTIKVFVTRKKPK